ncbi:winged helix-turn-helix transcriptional regulator [Sphingopyxis macrogoltabida]|uniref:winged helix-turn-helix transcriptional regulator n=1 Tax=Sphingopyxis macrogoltabida TaxID=33050 RepID=UPI0006ED0B09|nr:helix-turn-helix domain-containing protein [Sphingopyxis macrogoltabida]ALJ16477.1 transcriptional regulator [Sphingopyxis macrogoltabida]
MATERLNLRGRRPIMALLDLLGQRWALRILWELRSNARTSRDLREAIGISPTVLQARLDELRAAGLAYHEKGSGYRLTRLGVELIAAFAPLYGFASHWAEALTPGETTSAGARTEEGAETAP